MKPLSKIRKSARGQDCQVRIPFHCDRDPEKVVLAHKNGAGLSLKDSDAIAAYCCDGCHSLIDGKKKQDDYTQDEILVMFYEGIFRTQRLLIEQGLLVIK